MPFAKRERWTEADIDALPAGEHDYFDRKSGQLADDPSKLIEALAKALSAFANSGGGSLLLGVKDDGSFDGVAPQVGKTSTREWLEQKIPGLVDYPLSDFRVHEVERGMPTRIPPQKEIFVIDVGDSLLAPHQRKSDKIYFYRAGGHSVGAPHFYLELIRQRLTHATLVATPLRLTAKRAVEHDIGLFLETTLAIRVENIGRIAAYKWAISPRQILNIPEKRADDIFVHGNNYPIKTPGIVGVRLDDTILPGLSIQEVVDIGFQLRPRGRTRKELITDIEGLIGPPSLTFHVVTETSPGEEQVVALAGLFDVPQIVGVIEEACPGWLEN
jgi:hypothetical protein